MQSSTSAADPEKAARRLHEIANAIEILFGFANRVRGCAAKTASTLSNQSPPVPDHRHRMDANAVRDKLRKKNHVLIGLRSGWSIACDLKFLIWQDRLPPPDDVSSS